jgi:hypothetical protein
MRRFLFACLFGLCFFTHVSAMAGPTQALDIEGGWVFPGYNDVRVPGDSGTTLSLTDDLSADSFPAFRARYTVTLAGKHDGVLVGCSEYEQEGSTGHANPNSGA